MRALNRTGRTVSDKSSGSPIYGRPAAFMLLCLPAYFVTEIGLSTIEPSMPLTDTEYVLTSPVSSS